MRIEGEELAIERSDLEKGEIRSNLRARERAPLLVSFSVRKSKEESDSLMHFIFTFIFFILFSFYVYVYFIITVKMNRSLVS